MTTATPVLEPLKLVPTEILDICTPEKPLTIGILKGLIRKQFKNIQGITKIDPISLTLLKDEIEKDQILRELFQDTLKQGSSSKTIGVGMDESDIANALECNRRLMTANEHIYVMIQKLQEENKVNIPMDEASLTSAIGTYITFMYRSNDSDKYEIPPGPPVKPSMLKKITPAEALDKVSRAIEKAIGDINPPRVRQMLEKKIDPDAAEDFKDLMKNFKMQMIEEKSFLKKLAYSMMVLRLNIPDSKAYENYINSLLENLGLEIRFQMQLPPPVSTPGGGKKGRKASSKKIGGSTTVMTPGASVVEALIRQNLEDRMKEFITEHEAKLEGAAAAVAEAATKAASAGVATLAPEVKQALEDINKVKFQPPKDAGTAADPAELTGATAIGAMTKFIQDKQKEVDASVADFDKQKPVLQELKDILSNVEFDPKTGKFTTPSSGTSSLPDAISDAKNKVESIVAEFLSKKEGYEDTLTEAARVATEKAGKEQKELALAVGAEARARLIATVAAAAEARAQAFTQANETAEQQIREKTGALQSILEEATSAKEGAAEGLARILSFTQSISQRVGTASSAADVAVATAGDANSKAELALQQLTNIEKSLQEGGEIKQKLDSITASLGEEGITVPTNGTISEKLKAIITSLGSEDNASSSDPSSSLYAKKKYIAERIEGLVQYINSISNDTINTEIESQISTKLQDVNSADVLTKLLEDPKIKQDLASQIGSTITSAGGGAIRKQIESIIGLDEETKKQIETLRENLTKTISKRDALVTENKKLNETFKEIDGIIEKIDKDSIPTKPDIKTYTDNLNQISSYLDIFVDVNSLLKSLDELESNSALFPPPPPLQTSNPDLSPPENPVEEPVKKPEPEEEEELLDEPIEEAEAEETKKAKNPPKYAFIQSFIDEEKKTINEIKNKIKYESALQNKAELDIHKNSIEKFPAFINTFEDFVSAYIIENKTLTKEGLKLASVTWISTNATNLVTIYNKLIDVFITNLNGNKKACGDTATLNDENPLKKTCKSIDEKLQKYKPADAKTVITIQQIQTIILDYIEFVDSLFSVRTVINFRTGGFSKIGDQANEATANKNFRLLIGIGDDIPISPAYPLTSINTTGINENASSTWKKYGPYYSVLNGGSGLNVEEDIYKLLKRANELASSPALTNEKTGDKETEKTTEVVTAPVNKTTLLPLNFIYSAYGYSGSGKSFSLLNSNDRTKPAIFERVLSYLQKNQIEGATYQFVMYDYYGEVDDGRCISELSKKDTIEEVTFFKYNGSSFNHTIVSIGEVNNQTFKDKISYTFTTGDLTNTVIPIYKKLDEYRAKTDFSLDTSSQKFHIRMTPNNNVSSRAHLFIDTYIVKGGKTIGKITVMDMAGSEKVDVIQKNYFETKRGQIYNIDSIKYITNNEKLNDHIKNIVFLINEEFIKKKNTSATFSKAYGTGLGNLFTLKQISNAFLGTTNDLQDISTKILQKITFTDDLYTTISQQPWFELYCNMILINKSVNYDGLLKFIIHNNHLIFYNQLHTLYNLIPTLDLLIQRYTQIVKHGLMTAVAQGFSPTHVNQVIEICTGPFTKLRGKINTAITTIKQNLETIKSYEYYISIIDNYPDFNEDAKNIIKEVFTKKTYEKIISYQDEYNLNNLEKSKRTLLEYNALQKNIINQIHCPLRNQGNFINETLDVLKDYAEALATHKKPIGKPSKLITPQLRDILLNNNAFSDSNNTFDQKLILMTNIRLDFKTGEDYVNNDERHKAYYESLFTSLHFSHCINPFKIINEQYDKCTEITKGGYENNYQSYSKITPHELARSIMYGGAGKKENPEPSAPPAPGAPVDIAGAVANAKEKLGELSDIKRDLNASITAFDNMKQKVDRFMSFHKTIMDPATGDQEIIGAYNYMKEEGIALKEDFKKTIDTQRKNLKTLQGKIAKIIQSEQPQTPILLKWLALLVEIMEENSNKSDSKGKQSRGVYNDISSFYTSFENAFNDAFSKAKSRASAMQEQKRYDAEIRARAGPYGYGYQPGISKEAAEKAQADAEAKLKVAEAKLKEAAELAAKASDKGSGSSVPPETAKEDINVDLITNGLNNVLTNIVGELIKMYMRRVNPAMSVFTSDSLFNRILNDYVANRNETNEAEMRDRFMSQLEANNLIPRKVLQVTTMDKIVFIFVTLFLRILCGSIVVSLIERGIIKNMTWAVSGYLILYTLVLLAFVGIVNLDMYRMRIIFNYINFHANSGKLYMHIGLLYILGILIYVIMSRVNLPVRNVTPKSISDNEKLRLIMRFQILTGILWVVLAIVIMISSE